MSTPFGNKSGPAGETTPARTCETTRNCCEYATAGARAQRLNEAAARAWEDWVAAAYRLANAHDKLAVNRELRTLSFYLREISRVAAAAARGAR